MIKSQVFFIKLSESHKIKKILPYFSFLAIKTHFGESGNKTYLPAHYVKKICGYLTGPTLIETSVLYKSPRHTASGHRQVACGHGFDFAPIDFLDGELGDDFTEVMITGKHFTKCYLGKGLEKYKSLLVISHFKGHGGSGFGGALKNLGMGLASRKGKLAMHASIKHKISEKKCIVCGQCLANCPVSAIFFNKNGKAQIIEEVCISCSKCISVCPSGAIKIPWDSTGTKDLQERIVEYASAAVKSCQCFYINFLVNITRYCDCNNALMEKLCPDIGILASVDPIAIDQASYDLIIKQDKNLSILNGDYQLKYGEELGLGSTDYELINL